MFFLKADQKKPTHIMIYLTTNPSDRYQAPTQIFIEYQNKMI